MHPGLNLPATDRLLEAGDHIVEPALINKIAHEI